MSSLLQLHTCITYIHVFAFTHSVFIAIPHNDTLISQLILYLPALLFIHHLPPLVCVCVCVCVCVYVRACVVMPGAGHEWGGLEVQLHNRGGKPLRVLYLDMVPWFVRIYLHTLRIEAVGEERNPLASSEDLPAHYSKPRVSAYYAFTSNTAIMLRHPMAQWHTCCHLQYKMYKCSAYPLVHTLCTA